MARKSRKNIIENTTVVPKIYKAAAYLRLSVVKNDVPPDSIENQLRIIKDFIERHPISNLNLLQFDRGLCAILLKFITLSKF